LTITKSGDILWKVQKFTLDAQGDVLLKTTGKMDVQAGQDITVKSDGKLSAKSTQTTLDGGGSKVDLSASGAKIDAPSLTLLDGTAAAVHDSPDFQQWITKVTSLLANPGPVTGMAGLTPPTNYTNPKVKV
jgi:hypothetical protein